MASSSSDLRKKATKLEGNQNIPIVKARTMRETHPKKHAYKYFDPRDYVQFLFKKEEELKLNQKLHDVQVKTIGVNHSESLFTKHRIARCYYYLGEHEKALHLYQQVYDIQIQTLGRDHLHTLHTQLKMAASYSSLGKKEIAQRLYQQVNDVQTQVLGEDHPQTMSTRCNIANCYFFMEREEEALAIFEQIFQVQSKVLGEDHPQTLRTRYNIARCFFVMEKEEEALAIFEQIFQVQTKFLGEDHPQTMSTGYNIANCYFNMRKEKEALKIFEQIFQVQTKVLGKDHPQTMSTRFNIANCYFFMEREEEALAIFEQTFQVQTIVLGEDHPQTLRTRYNIARCFFVMEKEEIALAIFEHIFQVQTKLLGEDHPQTMSTRYNIANCYFNMRKEKEALAIFEQIFQVQTKVLGEYHPQTMRTRSNIANCYFNMRKEKEALAIFEQIFQVQTKFLGEDHPQSMSTRLSIANCYFILGEIEQAVEMYEQLYYVLTQVLGKYHPRAMRTKDKMACGYFHVGDKKKAQEWYEKLYYFLTKVLRKDHHQAIRTKEKMAFGYFHRKNYEEMWKLMYMGRKFLRDEKRLEVRDVFYQLFHAEVQRKNNPQTMGTLYDRVHCYLHPEAKEIELQLYPKAMRTKMYEAEVKIKGEHHADIYSIKQLIPPYNLLDVWMKQLPLKPSKALTEVSKIQISHTCGASAADVTIRSDDFADFFFIQGDVPLGLGNPLNFSLGITNESISVLATTTTSSQEWPPPKSRVLNVDTGDSLLHKDFYELALSKLSADTIIDVKNNWRKLAQFCDFRPITPANAIEVLEQISEERKHLKQTYTIAEFLDILNPNSYKSAVYKTFISNSRVYHQLCQSFSKSENLIESLSDQFEKLLAVDILNILTFFTPRGLGPMTLKNILSHIWTYEAFSGDEFEFNDYFARVVRFLGEELFLVTSDEKIQIYILLFQNRVNHLRVSNRFQRYLKVLPMTLHISTGDVSDDEDSDNSDRLCTPDGEIFGNNLKFFPLSASDFEFLNENKVLVGSFHPSIRLRCYQSLYNKLLEDGATQVSELSNVRKKLIDCFIALKENSAAVPLLRLEYEKQIQDIGHDHPLSIESRDSIAELMFEYDASAAIGFLELDFARQVQKLGDTHPRTEETQDLIANLLIQNSAYEQAVNLMQANYLRKYKVFSKDHKTTLEARKKLASCYHSCRLISEAIEFLQSEWKRQVAELGNDDARTLESRDQLVQYLKFAGRYGIAVKILEEEFIRQAEKWGCRHRMTVDTKKKLLKCFSERGNQREAELLLHKIWNKEKEKFGIDHPTSIQFRDEVVNFLRYCNKVDEAVKILEEDYNSLKNNLGPHDMKCIDTKLALIECNLLQDNKKEVSLETLFKDYMELLIKFGFSDPRTEKIFRMLLSIVRRQENKSEATRKIIDDYFSYVSSKPSLGDEEIINYRGEVARFLKDNVGPVPCAEFLNNDYEFHGGLFGFVKSRTMKSRDFFLDFCISQKLYPTMKQFLQSDYNKKLSVRGWSDAYTIEARNLFVNFLKEQDNEIQHALGILRKDYERGFILGWDHHLNIEVSQLISECLRKGRDYQELEKFHTEEFNQCILKLNVNHPRTLQSRDSLVDTFQLAGKNEEAIKLLESNYGHMITAPGRSHPLTIATMKKLADAKWWKDLDECIDFLKSEYYDYSAALNVSHPAVQAIRNLILKYLEEEKRHAEAADFKKVTNPSATEASASESVVQGLNLVTVQEKSFALIRKVQAKMKGEVVDMAGNCKSIERAPILAVEDKQMLVSESPSPVALVYPLEQTDVTQKKSLVIGAINIPYQNDKSVGRNHELTLMKKALTEGDTVILKGGGGMGKSILAITYVYSYGKNFSNVIWIDAGTKASMLAAFKLVAERLEVLTAEEFLTLEDLSHSHLEMMYAKLCQYETLMVFDHAEGYDDFLGATDGIRPYFPLTFPGKPPVKTIVTTRNSLGWESVCSAQNIIHLHPFSRNDSKLFILSNLSENVSDREVNWEKLADFCDYLPIPIEYSVSIINCNAHECKGLNRIYSIVEFLSEFRISYPIPETSRDLPEILSILWDVTIKKLEFNHGRVGKVASKLLNIIAFLLPSEINHLSLMKLVRRMDMESNSPRVSESEVETALSTLYSMSLCTRKCPSKVFMRRLLGETRLSSLKQSGEFFTSAIQITNAFFPKVNVTNTNELTRENGRKFGSKLSHEILPGELLSVLLKNMDVLLTFDEHVRFRVCLQIALHFNANQSKDLYVKNVLKIIQVAENLHPDHIAILKPALMSNLSGLQAYMQSLSNCNFNISDQILEYIRDNPEAAQLLRQTVVASVGSPSNDANSVKIRHTMFECLKYGGLCKKAADFLEQEFIRQQRHLGADNHETLATRDKIADCLVYGGMCSDAADFLRVDYNRQQEKFGSDDLRTISTREKIVECLIRGKLYKEAAAFLAAEYIRQNLLYGCDHVLPVETCNAISDCLTSGELYKDASDFLFKILLLQQRQLGYDHPRTIETMNKIVNNLIYGRYYTEATDFLIQVLRRQQEELGPDDIRTMETRDRTVQCLLLSRSYKDAIKLLESDYQRQTKTLGPDDPLTIETRNQIINSLLSFDEDGEKALKLLETDYSRQVEELGHDDARTIDTRNKIAECLSFWETHLKGAEYLLKDYERQRHALGSDDPRSIATRDEAIDYLIGGQQYKEAIDFLQTDYVKQGEQLGLDHPCTISTRNATVKSLTYASQFSKASAFLRKDFERQRAQLGPNHPLTTGTQSLLLECLKYIDSTSQ